MSTTQKMEMLGKALAAALFRLGVGTAVFEPVELTISDKLRCRSQADGSIAVILLDESRDPRSNVS